MKKNFLLTSRLAKKLYKTCKDYPIIDYHSHLSIKNLYENKLFDNFTDASIKDDDYKMRITRSSGFSEEYVSGNKTDFEKFQAFMSSIRNSIGNPLYDWFLMELKTFYNVDNIYINDLELYNKLNNCLKNDDLRPLNVLKNLNVKIAYTTNSPLETLEYHKKINDNDIKILPTFRLDLFINCTNNEYLNSINNLIEVTGLTIGNINDLIDALENRLIFFKEVGSTISDQSFENFIYVDNEFDSANKVFIKLINKEQILEEERNIYVSYLFNKMAKLYHKHNIVMQLHLGALRNNSSYYFNLLGKDCGCDSINDEPFIKYLIKFFDDLDVENSLPKTVIYALNEHQNTIISSMIPSFNLNTKGGKIHLGTAWWYNDHLDGIKRNMKVIMNQTNFSNFLGMLTDSSNVFSYVRIDYFRRILCSVIADEVNNGLFTKDKKILNEIIQKICYKNIEEFLRK